MANALSVHEKVVTISWQFFGNKAEGRISERVLEENKPRQIFRKTNISYPLIRISGGKKFLLACFIFL